MTAETSQDLTVTGSAREPLGPHDPPRQRRVPFEFSGPCPPYWLGGGYTGSVLLNSYTLIFPSMEAMMVRQIVKVAGRPGAPGNQELLRAFCKQEGTHSQAHRRSIECVREQGYEIDKTLRRIDRTFSKILEATFTWLVYPNPLLGDKFAVGLLAGIEHWTAVISETSLTPGTFIYTLGNLGGPVPDPATVPEMEILYLWHACEELEHKNVVHDFMVELGAGEITRLASFVMVTIPFFVMSVMCFVALLRQAKRVLEPLVWENIGEVGGWRGVRREFASLTPMWRGFGRALRLYLKRGYHPDQLATDHLIEAGFERLDALRTIKMQRAEAA